MASMNNAAKIEAFKSYYKQAKEMYAANEFDTAKELFIKAASLANEISLESTSYDVRMDYHAQADKILRFLKGGFGKKTIVNETSKDNEEQKSFNPEVISEENKITFADVAGLDDVKDEIKFNVIEPLKNPELAKAYKINPGAKILLYGPPGTGKTFIARAIAGEVEAKFYAINCQDLISKYMGESSKQIDALFEDAQKNKRAIIFFDEFDSVASKRESDAGSVDAEMSRFVASFLTKVDGFKKPKDCEMLLLIAATNRPWAIDSAMLRGGRFDTHIYVGLPDYGSRVFLVKKEFEGVTFSSDLSVELIAERLERFGGADIVSACRKIKQLAYRRAVKTNKVESVSLNDFNTVFQSLRPSVNEEELNKFQEFKGNLIWDMNYLNVQFVDQKK